MSNHKKNISNIVLKKGYDKKYLNYILNEIKKCKDADVIAIYNPDCIGIMNSTKELFKFSIPLVEIFLVNMCLEIADALVSTKANQIIFSSITFGWKNLIENISLKNNSIKLKFLWHGSHAMLVQKNESYFLYNILELSERNIISSIGFAKESMAEFYKLKNYNSFFVPNNVCNIKSTFKPFEKENEKKYIGLYSAGNRWEKNTFNQLSAVSMLKNSCIDIIPVTDLVDSFCKMTGVHINDKNIKYLERQDLFNRMALNDVNLYVTFTECSPMLPLESLELGVPCITGNNHHYFRNSKLSDYLIVKAEDDIKEIYEKIKFAISNKDEIINLYKIWKNEYNLFCENKLSEFLND